ncbi:hypothetical protein [Streptomyces olivaceoviridis]|uniref:hypothetical protein n=1 Tax=Streptomyces olivaceoviridis TaxID=1921 RepID=UPI001675608A|nr:hypothetical protein [Streptomyces olivaceoviridis]
MKRLAMSSRELYSPLANKMLQHAGKGQRSEGYVQVEEFRPGHLLSDDDTLPSVFLLFSPYETRPWGKHVACTEEEFRRWRDAAHAYAESVDRISAEVAAVRQRVARARRWKFREWRRAEEAWEQARRRYSEAVQAADVAYAPVRLEIRAGINAEEERQRAEAVREQEAQRHRAELAARPLWGWAAFPDRGGARVVYVFRHDVASTGVPEAALTADAARVHLWDLRRALTEQLARGSCRVVWDDAALAETQSEFDGVTLGRWWYDTFGEDFRTCRKPEPRSNAYGGGTGAGGTGGFVGGTF